MGEKTGVSVDISELFIICLFEVLKLEVGGEFTFLNKNIKKVEKTEFYIIYIVLSLVVS